MPERVGQPEPGGLSSETVNVGRHTLTQMGADEWSERLQQMTGERLEALAALAAQHLATHQQGDDQ